MRRSRTTETATETKTKPSCLLLDIRTLFQFFSLWWMLLNPTFITGFGKSHLFFEAGVGLQASSRPVSGFEERDSFSEQSSAGHLRQTITRIHDLDGASRRSSFLKNRPFFGSFDSRIDVAFARLSSMWVNELRPASRRCGSHKPTFPPT